MYVSHTPTHQSSHDALHYGFQPTYDAFPKYPHDFHSKLHTEVPKNIGFGSHEGKSSNYEVSEEPETDALLQSRSSLRGLSSDKNFGEYFENTAYPYPLPQDELKVAEYLFGFDPTANSYDLTDF